MSQSLADQLATTALSGGNAGFHRGSLRAVPDGPEQRRSGLGRYFAGLKANGARDAATARIRERLLARARQPAGGPAGGRYRCRERQAGRGVAAHPGLCESRPPDRQSGSARPAGARQALRPRSRGISGCPTRTSTPSSSPAAATRPSPSAPSSRIFWRDLKFIYTDTIGAEFAHVSDTDERLWLQDRFQSAAHAAPIQRRGEEEHSLAIDRGRGTRALPAYQVRRPEALLARGRRQSDSACSTIWCSRAARPASKRPSSAWRIAAASMCW